MKNFKVFLFVASLAIHCIEIFPVHAMENDVDEHGNSATITTTQVQSSLSASEPEEDSTFEITVFDCAQGNTVTAKYKQKVMIFDAGRTGSSKFVAYADDKSNESVEYREYTLENKNKKIIKLEVPSERYSLKPSKENNTTYRQEFIEEVKQYAKGDNNENTLQAIFISHPDTDHYNLIPQVNLLPKVFVLGGQYESYSKIFRTHAKKTAVVKNENYGLNGSLNSYITHQSFREHCSFGTENDDPKVEILSVNAGGSGNKNEDSMIIRLSQTYSMIIPGDAEEKTWNDAEANTNTNTNTKKLEADVLLLSHHGSMTHKSTSVALLNKIKPKMCLISAGFQHNHPAAGAFHCLLEYFTKEPYRTPYHFITYHEKDIRKSFVTNLPVFTTIDNGALTVDLGADNLSVTVSRDFEPTPDNWFVEEEKFTRLYFNRSVNKSVINLGTLKKLNNGSLLNDTNWGEDVYRVTRPQGVGGAEDYYYKFGNAFFEVELWEEGDNSEEGKFKRKVDTTAGWFTKHNDIWKYVIKFTGVEWIKEKKGKEK